MNTRTGYITCDDAREWLTTKTYQADLVLTDPPHLDNFKSAEEHRLFVNQWMPLALEARKRYGTLIHSCGESPAELLNYMPYVPDQIRVWPHAAGFHFHLIYGSKFINGINYDDKPFPLWENIITEEMDGQRGLVIDPFCGRGEIPYAAREVGCYYRGCDIDPESIALCINEKNL